MTALSPRDISGTINRGEQIDGSRAIFTDDIWDLQVEDQLEFVSSHNICCLEEQKSN